METNQLRLSPSCIKTFVGSKSKWAGQYILGVKDSYDNKDALSLGKMFENRLFTGQDDWSIVEGIEIENPTKFNKEYEALKRNSVGLKFEKGEQQVEIKGEIFGHPFIGYIDNLTEEWIDDLKTIQYLSKEDDSKNFWSGMSYWDEYQLQLWLYMVATGRKKSRILEVSKFDYKDKRHAHQIIEFNYTEEWNKKMEEKYKPIIDEMYELYNKFIK